MPVLRLADYLREDLVFWDLPQLPKAAFLEAFAAEVVARIPGLTHRDLCDHLLARETERSTGIGHGLALPHAVIRGLDSTIVAVGRAPSGLDFDALDSLPVDLLFLVLSPPAATSLHLRVLARLARIIDSQATLARLRAAKDGSELFRVLLAEDARHA